MGDKPFAIIMNDIKSVPDWIWEDEIFDYAKQLISEIKYFDEEDIEKASSFLDQRKGLIREHAQKLERKQDDPTIERE